MRIRVNEAYGLWTSTVLQGVKGIFFVEDIQIEYPEICINGNTESRRSWVLRCEISE
jgi:hypothetical protein